jgi:hypothetical protein
MIIFPLLSSLTWLCFRKICWRPADRKGHSICVCNSSEAGERVQCNCFIVLAYSLS